MGPPAWGHDPRRKVQHLDDLPSFRVGHCSTPIRGTIRCVSHERMARMADVKLALEQDTYEIDPNLVAEALLRRLDLRHDPPVPWALSPRGARSRAADEDPPAP